MKRRVQSKVRSTMQRLRPLVFTATAFLFLSPVSANANTTSSMVMHGDTAFSTMQQFTLAHNTVPMGPASAYQQYKNMFPQSWGQLNGNQDHNSVFSVPSNAPSFLTKGTFWASPLTGDEFLRLARAFNRYPQDGGQAWGAEIAQWLGNATGVSVVDGIVYVEDSNGMVFAVDAATGKLIWQARRLTEIWAMLWSKISMGVRWCLWQLVT